MHPVAARNGRHLFDDGDTPYHLRLIRSEVIPDWCDLADLRPDSQARRGGLRRGQGSSSGSYGKDNRAVILALTFNHRVPNCRPVVIRNVVSSDAGVWGSRLVAGPTRIAPSFWSEIRGKAMLTEKLDVDSFSQFVFANEARLRHALIATRNGGGAEK